MNLEEKMKRKQGIAYIYSDSLLAVLNTKF